MKTLENIALEIKDSLVGNKVCKTLKHNYEFFCEFNEEGYYKKNKMVGNVLCALQCASTATLIYFAIHPELYQNPDYIVPVIMKGVMFLLSGQIKSEILSFRNLILESYRSKE